MLHGKSRGEIANDAIVSATFGVASIFIGLAITAALTTGGIGVVTSAAFSLTICTGLNLVSSSLNLESRYKKWLGV